MQVEPLDMMYLANTNSNSFKYDDILIYYLKVKACIFNELSVVCLTIELLRQTLSNSFEARYSVHNC